MLSVLIYLILHFFSVDKSSIHTMTPIISPAPLPRGLDEAGQSMGELPLAFGFLQ